ncbi:MAG: 50S ribosomal protein L17 [Candidatus Omnitrophota bacterium]
MRHKDKRLQLNRFTSWYKATMISMARSVLINQSIKTTKHRAMAVKPLVEKLITLAKEDTLTARRRAFQILGDHKLVSALFKDIGPRFAKRTGGYVRVIGLGNRRGDGAEMSILEFTEIKKREVKKPKKEAVKGEEKTAGKPSEQSAEEHKQKPRTDTAVKEEKHPENKKPAKKFLGGIRNIFKKERDSL